MKDLHPAWLVIGLLLLPACTQTKFVSLDQDCQSKGYDYAKEIYQNNELTHYTCCRQLENHDDCTELFPIE